MGLPGAGSQMDASPLLRTCGWDKGKVCGGNKL